MKVVIVGGVAGGASCAARLRRLDESAQILMVERGPYVSYANCGLPYHVGGVIPEESSLLVASPEMFRGFFSVEVRTGCEAVKISPDDKTGIFARGHNLFMMDAENYKLALKDFGDPKVQEVQITTDGVEHYSFARRMNEQAKTTLKKDQKGDTKHKDGPRVPAIALQWAKDSSKYSGVRQDLRKVADLWVINSLASPRPKRTPTEPTRATA